MVETVLDEKGLLVLGLSLLLFSGGLGDSIKTSLLLLLGLRAVPNTNERITIETEQATYLFKSLNN